VLHKGLASPFEYLGRDDSPKRSSHQKPPSSWLNQLLPRNPVQELYEVAVQIGIAILVTIKKIRSMVERLKDGPPCPPTGDKSLQPTWS
jgi:hypothetical protein